MKRAGKIALAVGTALSLGLAAAVVNAHPQGYGYGPGGGMGMGMGMGGGMGGGMGWGGQGYGMGRNATASAEGRLAYLKSELKITPTQEGAWQAFAGKAKQQAEAMQAWREKMWNTPQPTTAPERAAQHNEFMKQRVAQMDGMTSALKDLYASLTPEQKAIMDQGHGGSGGYGPGRGGPGGRFR